MSKPIEYYLAPGWEDVHRPRIQELLDRIEELQKVMIDFCATYDGCALLTLECNQDSIKVNTDYFNEAFRKALGAI